MSSKFYVFVKWIHGDYNKLIKPIKKLDNKTEE